MKQKSDTNGHPGRRLAALLALAAVGVVLVVVAISTIGGGYNAPSYRAANARPTPTVRTAKANGHVARRVTVPKAPAATVSRHPAPKSTAKPSSAIPQQNGGDGDSDNNGGTNDGDGDI